MTNLAVHKDLRNRVRRLTGTGPDERGSLIMVLAILMTVTVLVLTVATIAISQQVLSNRTVQRNDALQAAEAGLDAAVGEVRAANDGLGDGVTQDLPCDGNGSTGFTLTGYLGSSSATKYSVTVTYYTNAAEPTLTNINNSSAQAINCYAYASPSYPSAVPSYATITSTGQDPQNGPTISPSRTIDEIYAFTNNNQNIPGGLITDFQGATDDLCMSANNSDTDVTPAASDNVYVATCLTAGDEDQTWEYDANFTLVLTSTIPTKSDPSSTQLCLQGDVSSDTVQLAACLSSSSPNFYTQQWGINDNGGYQTVGSNGAPASQDLCINESSNSSGSQVDLSGCAGGQSNQQSWQPNPAVGPGDAGAAMQQFVNYEQFGNCMDVTNQDTGSSYLIDYMCKQFPDGPNWSSQSGTNPYDPIWNQRFASASVTYAGDNGSYTELQTHVLPANSGSTVYCLWSPDNTTDGVTDPSGSNPSWVTVQPCPTLQTGNVVPTGSTGSYGNTGFLWTVNTSTTYNVTDYWGNCLNADTADLQQPAGGSWFATLTDATCTANYAAEEWNAPSTTNPATESHLFEPGITGN